MFVEEDWSKKREGFWRPGGVLVGDEAIFGRVFQLVVEREVLPQIFV